MVRFLVRRLIWGIITLFLFQTLIFFIGNLLVPGDWATQFSLGATPEQLAELRHQLGLDLPLGQQYLNWLQNFFNGSMGYSMTGIPVSEVLKRVMPSTLLIFASGTVLAFSLGYHLGKVTAWRQGVVSSGTTLGSILLYTSFPAWLAFLMGYVLRDPLRSLRDRLVPKSSFDLWRTVNLLPENVMWYMLFSLVAVLVILFGLNKALQRIAGRRLPLIVSAPLFLLLAVGSWYAFGFGMYALDVVFAFAMPLLTFVFLSFGETMLITRTNMMDTLKEEYISTARAKGVPERLVRDKHAARNALLPVLSRFVISLPYLLTGLVIIEHALGVSGRPAIPSQGMFQSPAVAWGGMGWAMYTGLYFQDLPIVMGALFVVGVLAIVARVVIDLLHAYLDPRMRFQSRS